MVTAETALVLPVLVCVAVGLAWLVVLGAAQVRCVDAAREVARLSARGESAATVAAAVAGWLLTPGGRSARKPGWWWPRSTPRSGRGSRCSESCRPWI